MNRNLYILFLNGDQYGLGDLKYINNLIFEFTETMLMYGKEKVDFSIVKYHSGIREGVIND